MSEMVELKKGTAYSKIVSIAMKFDNRFSDCFVDAPMRVVISTESGVNDEVNIKLLASTIDGNFVSYDMYYNTNNGELFMTNKTMKRAFNDSISRIDNATKAIKMFLVDLNNADIPYAVNKVMLDLNVLNYNKVKIGESKIEEGSIVMHICTYNDQVKEDFGICDAKNVVGDDAIGRELINF